jgi:phage host-nuclease inhibitor protein Gam
MYLKPTCKITVADFSFEWSNAIEINTGWKLLTDTAVIKIPANITFKEDSDSKDSKRKIIDHIPVKAPVSVALSANGKLTTFFEGYVTKIHSKLPLELECEDEMHMLKQGPIQYSEKQDTLANVLKTHFVGYDTNFIKTKLGNFSIDNETPAQVLQRLNKEFGLHSFFRGKTLCVGTQFDTATQAVVAVNLDNEVIDESLEYIRADEVKLKVIATSHLPNGDKLEVTLGDDDGEQRTLNFYDVPESGLKEAAEREMLRFKYDGWRGDLTILGVKPVKHGDVVELHYEVEGENQTSRYYADAVTYSFGVSGFRQKVELGMRAQ